MVRTQIQLTEKQSKTLKAAATREGVSVAALIRRIIDRSTRHGQIVDDDELWRRATSAVGCGRSGLGDLSERHDDYLAEVYSD